MCGRSSFTGLVVCQGSFTGLGIGIGPVHDDAVDIYHVFTYKDTLHGYDDKI